MDVNAINTIITTTTAAVSDVVTTAMPNYWKFLIIVGAVFMVAMGIVGIFFKRRGGRRRGR